MSRHAFDHDIISNQCKHIWLSLSNNSAIAAGLYVTDKPIKVQLTTWYAEYQLDLVNSFFYQNSEMFDRKPWWRKYLQDEVQSKAVKYETNKNNCSTPERQYYIFITEKALKHNSVAHVLFYWKVSNDFSTGTFLRLSLQNLTFHTSVKPINALENYRRRKDLLKNRLFEDLAPRWSTKSSIFSVFTYFWREIISKLS